LTIVGTTETGEPGKMVAPENTIKSAKGWHPRTP